MRRKKNLHLELQRQNESEWCTQIIIILISLKIISDFLWQYITSRERILFSKSKYSVRIWRNSCLFRILFKYYALILGGIIIIIIRPKIRWKAIMKNLKFAHNEVSRQWNYNKEGTTCIRNSKDSQKRWEALRQIFNEKEKSKKQKISLTNQSTILLSFRDIFWAMRG